MSHVHGPIVALIVAGGSGRRVGGDVPKQYRPLAGASPLARAVQRFAAHPRVGIVAVVVQPDDPCATDHRAGLDVLLLPVAGETRQATVLNGLEALAAAGPAPATVLVHDAARPFASAALIDRVIDAVRPDRGAAPVVAIADTVKEVDDDRIVGTVPRERLRRVQTPQGFPFAALLAAHRRARDAGLADLTDDVAVASAAGLAVVAVDGEEENGKLTVEADFARAERRLAEMGETRVAQGYDVHAFGEGDGITLCGVAIPHERGLVGHSDADVGLHALTDALLGTIGADDIGTHFPPSDPRWRGADSALFLAHALDLVRTAGGTPLLLDVTIVCEAPRIGPHRAAMRERIAAIAGVSPDRVSVKATTSERLGFTGRREGIAAFATATVRLAAPA